MKLKNEFIMSVSVHLSFQWKHSKYGYGLRIH